MNAIVRILALAIPWAAVVNSSAAEPVSRHIDQLTWTKLRDLIDDGHTTIILPTGGTEQNRPHMVLGKHNVIVKQAVAQFAARLKNAPVALFMAYVLFNNSLLDLESM